MKRFVTSSIFLIIQDSSLKVHITLNFKCLYNVFCSYNKKIYKNDQVNLRNKLKYVKLN